MRVQQIQRLAPLLSTLVLLVFAVPVLAESATAARHSSGELFSGDFGQWLHSEAIPELATLVGRHPRFRGEAIRVVSMEGGQPALGSNRLSAAVRDQLTHRLTRIKDVRVAWQTAPARCGVPRKTPYLLGVEITRESRNRSLVTIAMVDVEEGIWVSGGYLQWRGTLSHSERKALAQRVNAAPAGTIDSPLPGARRKEITAILLENIECSLRGGLDGGVQIVAADPNDGLLTGVAAQLRDALTRSATLSVVAPFTKASSNDLERADWILELRTTNDIGEAVVATLAPVDGDRAVTAGQRLAAVYVRRPESAALPALRTAQVPPAGKPVQRPENSAYRLPLIDQLHEVPAKPGDQCFRRSADCLEVQFDLTAPSYLLVLRTQPGGSLNLGSCSSPRKTTGTKRYRLQVRHGGAGFYAVATTDRTLAQRLHRQLASGARNCGDRSRSDWLNQFEATLAGVSQQVDWRAFRIPPRFGDDLHKPEAVAASQSSPRTPTEFLRGK